MLNGDTRRFLAISLKEDCGAVALLRQQLLLDQYGGSEEGSRPISKGVFCICSRLAVTQKLAFNDLLIAYLFGYNRHLPHSNNTCYRALHPEMSGHLLENPTCFYSSVPGKAELQGCYILSCILW